MGLLPSGTMAHSFILSFHQPLDVYIANNSDSKFLKLLSKELGNASFVEFASHIHKWMDRLFETSSSTPYNNSSCSCEGMPCFRNYRGNETELCSFAVFAFTQPHNFVALIDTYDVLNSGLLNFIIVGCAL